jgi:HD superfamily phosphodiesterase
MPANLLEASSRLALAAFLHDLGKFAECSGSIIPDTQIGGNLAAKEVFNEKTTSFLYS